ncbi:AraC family transcriptional regulator [Chitinophaga horti]|uniref:AraC family transcriptional regulator n=1 Tax=Chitinophaga horti TaxID=2920382 RepID=A0ABY6J5Z1_9BACT|nr:AraC family transcriptional regulator [Chitinophaga horti]UYQ95105.1 AraC family transcriptional regulator [Chitinophaga horti]
MEGMIKQQPTSLSCSFDINQNHGSAIRENRRPVNRPGHQGNIYELASPDGISLGYYNVQSSEPGAITFKNNSPFIQLSYTISGSKAYQVNGSRQQLASFKKQEYNYLFLPKEDIQLQWQPGERLEIFELGVSPELMLRYVPEEHPFFSTLHNSLEKNTPTPMSNANLSIQGKSSSILYEMLSCPMEGRYKQLYIKSKLGELLSMELEAYEQRNSRQPASGLKSVEIERMHQARSIILSNMQSPCSLIDLAHQVGTNEAYLKKHFKEVFGNTVYGYLNQVKMNEAKTMLLNDIPVSQVAFLTGYKYVSHFTRAFKKHFGVAPNKVRR